MHLRPHWDYNKRFVFVPLIVFSIFTNNVIYSSLIYLPPWKIYCLKQGRISCSHRWPRSSYRMSRSELDEGNWLRYRFIFEVSLGTPTTWLNVMDPVKTLQIILLVKYLHLRFCWQLHSTCIGNWPKAVSTFQRPNERQKGVFYLQSSIFIKSQVLLTEINQSYFSCLVSKLL